MTDKTGTSCREEQRSDANKNRTRPERKLQGSIEFYDIQGTDDMKEDRIDLTSGTIEAMVEAELAVDRVMLCTRKRPDETQTEIKKQQNRPLKLLYAMISFLVVAN